MKFEVGYDSNGLLLFDSYKDEGKREWFVMSYKGHVDGLCQKNGTYNVRKWMEEIDAGKWSVGGLMQIIEEGKINYKVKL